MKNNFISDILPRNIDDENLKIILDKYSTCIDEIVNCGTHILKIDYELKREGKDNNVPTLFLRNCLELADGISILMKSSSIDPSKNLLRTLLENSFSLIYMIQTNEKIRAHCFLVWKANNDLKFCKRLINEEQSSKEFVNQLKKENPNFELNDIRNLEGILKTIEAKNELLELPIYKEINDEYKRLKKNNRGSDFNWYSLFDGPRNFLKLSEELNSTLHYHFNFKKYSENVHGNNVLKGFISLHDDKAQLRQMRDFKDCREVFIQVIYLLLNLYSEFVEKRIPGQISDYPEWSKHFFENFKQVLNETKFNYIE